MDSAPSSSSASAPPATGLFGRAPLSSVRLLAGLIAADLVIATALFAVTDLLEHQNGRLVWRGFSGLFVFGFAISAVLAAMPAALVAAPLILLWQAVPWSMRRPWWAGAFGAAVLGLPTAIFGAWIDFAGRLPDVLIATATGLLSGLLFWLLAASPARPPSARRSPATRIFGTALQGLSMTALALTALEILTAAVLLCMLDFTMSWGLGAHIEEILVLVPVALLVAGAAALVVIRRGREGVEKRPLTWRLFYAAIACAVLALWTAALFLPQTAVHRFWDQFDFTSPRLWSPDGQTGGPGWMLAAEGWLGPLELAIGWYANIPLAYLVALLFTGRPPKRAMALATAAIAYTVLLPHVGTHFPANGDIFAEWVAGPSVWAWLASVTLMAIAGLTLDTSPIAGDGAAIAGGRTWRATGRFAIWCMVAVLAGLAAAPLLGEIPHRPVAQVDFPLAVRRELELWAPAEGSAVAWSPDGSRIAGLTDVAAKLVVWDRSGHELGRFDDPSQQGALAFLRDGSMLALAPQSGPVDTARMTLVDPVSGKVLANLGGPDRGGEQDLNPVRGFSVTADRALLAVHINHPHRDGSQLTVLRTQDWKPLGAYNIPSKEVVFKAFANGHKFTLATPSGRTFFVLDPDRGGWVKVDVAGPGKAVGVITLAGDPAGQLVFVGLAGDQANGAVVLRLADGARVAAFPRRLAAHVSDAEWDPQGRYVAFLADGGLYLWRPFARSLSYARMALGGGYLAISPDGAYVAATTANGLVVYSVK